MYYKVTEEIMNNPFIISLALNVTQFINLVLNVFPYFCSERFRFNEHNLIWSVINKN